MADPQEGEGLGSEGTAEPSGVSAPPGEGQEGAAATESSSLSEPPLQPLAAPPKAEGRKRGRPKGSRSKRRKLTPSEKRDRAEKKKKASSLLDLEVQRAAQIAKEEAAAGDSPGRKEDAPAAPEPLVDLAQHGPPAEGVALSEADMQQIIGLGAHGLARLIPDRFGGGSLTTEERDLLGRAWWAYLRPYLAGEGGPLTIALGATIQVFALRAIAAQFRGPDLPTAPAKADPASEPAATSPAKAGAAAKPNAGRSGLQAPAETVGRRQRQPDMS